MSPVPMSCLVRAAPRWVLPICLLDFNYLGMLGPQKSPFDIKGGPAMCSSQCYLQGIVCASRVVRLQCLQQPKPGRLQAGAQWGCMVYPNPALV